MGKDVVTIAQAEIKVGGELTTKYDLVREAMRYLPVKETVGSLPDLKGWNERRSQQKLHKLRQILSSPLYSVLTIGDHRLAPTDKDPLRTPYHNLIVPWMEEALTYFGEEKFLGYMRENRVDELVREMGAVGVLNKGTNPDSGWVSLAASTGSTPELWQYYEGIKTQEALWEIVNKEGWGNVKNELKVQHLTQQQRIKESYGFDESDVLFTTQSGTEDPLLNVLFGVTGTQVTDETGTSQVAAASGRHTSPKGWKGYAYVVEEQSKKMPKLVGCEKVGDAYEVKLRDADRKPRSRQEIYTEVRDWILKERGNVNGCRLMLGVTAGGKTGSVGWEYGGLSLDDAISLRSEFGGDDGLGILIKVDGAQGKLSKEEISRLKRADVMFSWTGSKDDQGPMFESKTYVPEKIANLARDYVEMNGFPEGLTDYIVESDVAELLGPQIMEKLSGVLDDMPNIPAMIKWDMVLATREEYFRDRKALSELKNLVRDFRTIFNGKLKKVNEKEQNKKGNTWSARILDEQPTHERMSPEFEGLMSLEIQTDGQVLTGEKLKAIQYQMGEPGESGIEVQLGQAVAGAEVIRVVLGKSARIGLMRAWSEGEAFTFTNKLCDVSIAKLSAVMEKNLAVNLFETAGIETEIATEHEGWIREEMRVVANNLNEQLRINILENNSVENKLGHIIGAYSKLFESRELMPVVVMSGKNAATLDASYRAWELSGREEELPISFVDHRYQMSNEYGGPVKYDESVYSNLSRALQKYPRTHLYLFGAGFEVIDRLNKDGWEGRYTICSRMPTQTNFEYNNPDWMNSLEEVSPEEAQQMNTRHKGEPTQEMFNFFENIANGRTVGYIRGNRPGQSIERQNTRPANVSKIGNYLGLHILAGLTEKNVSQYIARQKLLSTKGYVDWLKRVQKICGMDALFEWER